MPAAFDLLLTQRPDAVGPDAASKHPVVEQLIIGEIEDGRRVQGYDIGVVPYRQYPAPSAPHRRRDRMVEGAARRGTAGCGNDVAGFQRQALRIFELPELAGREISTLGSEPTPYRPPSSRNSSAGKGAIAEIGFGDRAEPAIAPRFAGLAVGHVGGVDQAPAVVDIGIVEQPFDRPGAGP